MSPAAFEQRAEVRAQDLAVAELVVEGTIADTPAAPASIAASIRRAVAVVLGRPTWATTGTRPAAASTTVRTTRERLVGLEQRGLAGRAAGHDPVARRSRSRNST